MRENALTILIMDYLVQALPGRGLVGYEVVKTYQPTQQGRAIQPSVIVYCTANNRYGSPRRSYKSSSPTSTLRTEVQYREATFKVTALLPPPDPFDMSAITHGDAVGTVAAILNSDDFISHIKLHNCGVLRISAVSNVPFENDLGQNEDNYSFDVIITHSDMFADGVPVISEYEYKSIPI